MIENNISVAISVSPSGVVIAVMLARRIAEEHRKTLVIDLTGFPPDAWCAIACAQGLPISSSATADTAVTSSAGDRLSGAHHCA